MIAAAVIASLLVVVGALALGYALGRRRPHGPATGEGWPDVEAELRRERRHGRPLTIARVPLSGLDDLDGCLHACARTLREGDHMVVEDGILWLALTEADGTVAAATVHRVLTCMEQPAARAAWATYPSDALTVGGLVALAEERAETVASPLQSSGAEQ